MSDSESASTDRPSNANEERLSDPLTAILRSALNEAPARSGSLLPGIQERIRKSTRGRYYKSRKAWLRDPTMLLLMAACLILLLSAIAFLVIEPLFDSKGSSSNRKSLPELVDQKDD